jgi:hypothetical protein
VARIRLDLVGVVGVHQEYGRNPLFLVAGEDVPDGYVVSADLLEPETLAGDPGSGAESEDPDTAPDPAVTTTGQDRGPQAGTVRRTTRRTRPGDEVTA